MEFLKPTMRHQFLYLFLSILFSTTAFAQFPADYTDIEEEVFDNRYQSCEFSYL